MQRLFIVFGILMLSVRPPVGNFIFSASGSDKQILCWSSEASAVPIKLTKVESETGRFICRHMKNKNNNKKNIINK